MYDDQFKYFVDLHRSWLQSWGFRARRTTLKIESQLVLLCV